MNKRFDGAPESVFWVYSQLREDVVLPLDPRARPIDTGRDHPLKEEFRAVFFDHTPEYVSVEGFSHGFTFLFKVSNSFERRKELLAH